MTRVAAALALAASAALTASGVGSELVTRDVYLMGTRARLATYAATRERGLATLDSALQILEQTEAELSTWRESSAISALNHHPVGQPWQANERLCRMFGEVWDWQRASGGTFDPGIGRLLTAWDIHRAGAVPDGQTHERARALSSLELLAFDRDNCTVTRRADATLDVGAFGKGEALDRVEAALADESWMVDLGGQVSVGGVGPRGGWPVAIAHPRHRRNPFLEVRLNAGSLSTSGGSERDLVVNGRRISHHFDPRTGRPASFDGSVTVWHRRGIAADALSTALFVMGPEEGVRWADDHGIAAVYLIPQGQTVRVEATRAFKTTPALQLTERE